MGAAVQVLLRGHLALDAVNLVCGVRGDGRSAVSWDGRGSPHRWMGSSRGGGRYFTGRVNGRWGSERAPSLRTAILPCLRIQRANLGSVFSVASAKSFWRHHSLWKGQYARWHLRLQKWMLWHLAHSARSSVHPQLPHSFGTCCSSWKCAAMDGRGRWVVRWVDRARDEAARGGYCGGAAVVSGTRRAAAPRPGGEGAVETLG